MQNLNYRSQVKMYTNKFEIEIVLSIWLFIYILSNFSLDDFDIDFDLSLAEIKYGNK